eukprot:scaffold1827_cov421-Prasinococcus_capsulatus_cf.AAC.4
MKLLKLSREVGSMAQTEPVCIAKVCTHRCCPKSHRRTVRSDDPDRRYFPCLSSTRARMLSL